jgi:hypothetical protein
LEWGTKSHLLKRETDFVRLSFQMDKAEIKGRVERLASNVLTASLILILLPVAAIVMVPFGLYNRLVKWGSKTYKELIWRYCLRTRTLTPQNRALAQAVLCGNANNVEVLLRRGADPNTWLRYGFPIIYFAATKGDAAIVRLLMEGGATADVIYGDNGFSPLICAAFNGHTETVLALIDHGADIESRSNLGVSPLIFAARNGHCETVKLLVVRGADLNSRSKYDVSAADIAEKRGHKEILEYLLAQGSDQPGRLRQLVRPAAPPPEELARDGRSQCRKRRLV